MRLLTEPSLCTDRINVLFVLVVCLELEIVSAKSG